MRKQRVKFIVWDVREKRKRCIALLHKLRMQGSRVNPHGLSGLLHYSDVDKLREFDCDNYTNCLHLAGLQAPLWVSWHCRKCELHTLPFSPILQYLANDGVKEIPFKT